MGDLVHGSRIPYRRRTEIFSCTPACASASDPRMRSFITPLFLAAAIAAQRIIPGGYIVELASVSSSKRGLDPHAEFLDALDKRSSGNFVTRQQYRDELFNGLAVQLTSPEDLIDIASLPNVVSVHPLHLHALPEPVSQRIVKEGEDHPALGASVHKLTGVDGVHAAGFKGKGIQIAILDSGVDYTHPALGGGFGPGFKVAGGTDLVGDDYDGHNTPIPDDDPKDCYGHGTHVAGIVGANPGNEYNVVGVAPEATIFIYKIGGCRGSIGDDVIIAALLRAAAEGANVITMSFGELDGWSNSATATVASRVADQGIVVAAAAGNSGDAGLLYTESPAIGENVIAVGSVENTAVITQTFTINADHEPFIYTNLAAPLIPGMAVPDVPETPLPVLALAPYRDGIPSAECNQPNTMPADIPADLSGFAIVLRGSDNLECAVEEFVSMRNPAVMILYKYPTPTIGTGYPTIIISDEDGDWLAEQATSGNLTVQFPGPLVDESTGAAGGLMNDYSTMGPGNLLEFRPALSAPGGDIMSTYLDGTWAIFSGTSMATPYAAASGALLLQAKGKNVASSVRSLLQSTSQGLPATRDKGSLPQTLAWQGAGLINVLSAIKTTTTISPAVLQLNDTAHWNKLHKITIKNGGTKWQTYSLAHIAAGTTVTKPADADELTLAPVPLLSAPARVSFSTHTVTVAPGHSTTILVTITAPSGVDPHTLPIVSGWITATSKSGEVVKVSYLGMAGSFHDAHALSTSAKLSNGRDAVPNIYGETSFQTGPANYTVRDPSVTPVYYFGLAAPTARILVDLVDAAVTLTSTHAKRTWSNWLPSLPGSHRAASAADAEYPILAPLAVYEYYNRGAYRGDLNRIFLRDFANGTRIPLGQYKVLIRVLRPFGDAAKAEDYDVHLSVQFGWVE